MRTIVFADRSGGELLPLTDDCPPALLPIAAKPLIIHCLEDLAMAGIRALTLVVSKHADLIKAALGSGARWGIAIDYVTSRGEEEPESVLQRMSVDEAQQHLCLRGDVLRSPAIATFLERIPADAENAEMVLDGVSAQVLHLRTIADREALDRLAWPPPAQTARGVNLPTIDVQPGRYHALATYADFHAANIEAVSGRIPGLILPGRSVALGLLVGRQSKVSPRSIRHGCALIGSHCRVDATAAFHGDVVVSDNVLIDRDAELCSSVVLPNTYIGQLVEIRNAIVRGSDLIRVDTGASLHVNDTFLIANLSEAGAGEYLLRPLNRLFALLLLIISAPLWPLAAALALWRQPRMPLTRARLRGNRIELNEFGIRQRRVFSAWQWHCGSPVLRFLPRLLAVATGDLTLVGTQPVTEAEAANRIEEWQREADRAPSGLIGPSQLLLPAEALEEDVILSDAVYARQRNLAKDLYYLALGVRKLFTREAWVG